MNAHNYVPKITQHERAQRDARIVALAASGKGPTEIGLMLGMSKQNVLHIVRRSREAHARLMQQLHASLA